MGSTQSAMRPQVKEEDVNTRVVRNEERIGTLEIGLHELKGAVKEIRDKLLGRLPNWATLIISILGMVSTGLIVAYFSKK